MEICEKIIFLEFKEKNINFKNEKRHYAHLNKTIKMIFNDGSCDFTLERIFEYDSKYFDDQLENGDEIYIPSFSKQILAKNYFKFLHFIDCKNFNFWVTAIVNYIIY